MKKKMIERMLLLTMISIMSFGVHATERNPVVLNQYVTFIASSLQLAFMYAPEEFEIVFRCPNAADREPLSVLNVDELRSKGFPIYEYVFNLANKSYDVCESRITF